MDELGLQHVCIGCRLVIRLGQHLLPPGLARSEHGFSWWYADIVDDAGDGVVLIWGHRLPFVPAPAGRHLAPFVVALAVYRNGREAYYALQSAPECHVTEAAGQLSIGASTFRSSIEAGAARLRADLDLRLPGSGRVTGVVEVVGPRSAVAASGGGPLGWYPIAVMAEGRADLEWDGGAARIRGRAYFDGNAAERPLGELGIDDWRWGRIAFPSREVVYFQLAPADGASVLSVDAQGEGQTFVDSAASFRDRGPGWFGLRRAASLTLDVGGEAIEVDFRHQVEDGFFYQRYLVEARSQCGEVGRGVAERVVPARLAQSWHRPLVRMRVAEVGAAPSLWYPLFSGSREGRWGRLLASMRGPRPQVAA